MLEPIRNRALLLSGPVALSALFTLAGAFGSPNAAVRATAVVAIVAWAVLALWALRHARAPGARHAQERQEQLMSELSESISREAAGADAELNRSRTLIREAVAQLNGTFRSMEEQSRRQRGTITGLIEQEGSVGVREFANNAGTLVGDLSRQLAENGREGVHTVQLIDEMAQQLDETFGLLGELEEQSEQIGRVWRSAVSPSISDPGSALRVFAFELKQLLERSTGFSDRIRSLVGSSRYMVGRVRSRIESTAEREIDTSVEANRRADAMVGDVLKLNSALAIGIGTVAACSDRIRSDVAQAVRMLQFEDITRQALGAGNVHLGRLQTLNEYASQLQRLVTATHASATVRQQAVEALSDRLQDSREVWAEPVHKPVSQLSLQAGSVELF